MRIIAPKSCLVAALAAAFATFLSPSSFADPLVGVEFDTGNLYVVDTADASLRLIGATGLPNAIGAIEFNPADGALYATTVAVFGGPNAALYRIDVSNSLDAIEGVELVGELGILNFEGGLAFSPAGTAYGFNGGANIPVLYTVDLTTGDTTAVGSLVDRHDINGLLWRSDGMLVGLDATEEQLVLVNPANAAIQTLIDLLPQPGSNGGMTLLDGTGYFATAGPTSPNPGSNELWSFDPFTGEHFLIGDFDDVIDGVGFSGLTIVPEPATLLILGLGGLALRRTRRPFPLA